MVELKRGFGFWTVLSLSIGSIMGTAIFFGASIGARYSGNLALVAWVILSLVSIYIAACFGELVSMFPKSGGVYEFSKQTYGRFTSFMTGWAAWLVGNISVAVLIVASINIIMPKSSIAVKFLLSSGIILALNLVALLGLEATSLISIGFAVAIVSVIVALVGRGLFAMNLDNLMPLVTHSPLSIFLTMFFLLETYFGWESATYLAEETKDPRKTIPRAIVAGTIVIAVLGFGMLIISLGVIGYQGLAGLGNESPTVILAHQLFGSNGAALIIAGIVLALIGSAASGIITMPRLVLAMARDKLFIEQLKAIHPRFNTPYKAIIFQSIVTVLLLFMVLGNYQLLLSILVPLAALMYIPVILSVAILRHRSPNAERPFKVPFGKVGPVIVSLFLLSTILIESLTDSSGFNLLRLSISIIMIGIPLYFLVELYFDPKMITDVSDFLSYASLLTENITYPKSLRNEIMSFLGDIKGKAVLEFGCGIGTFTTMLLRNVGPRGSVYAIHFSKNDLKIAGRRIEQQRWETEGYVYGDAKLIHDPEQFYRLHPDIPRADVIVSVGMLGYMQDQRRILKEMRQVLAEKGKVCFVEYSDFFHIIPSVEWLSDDRKIEQHFRDAGFSVRVTRVKSLFWNRIFIYGFKYEGIVVI